MAYATGRCMCHQALRLPFEVEDVIAMVRKVFTGRCAFHDGEDEVVPGVTVHHIGGHSKGLQSVRVKTRLGYVVTRRRCHASLRPYRRRPGVSAHLQCRAKWSRATRRSKSSPLRRATSCRGTIRWCSRAIRRRSPVSKAGSRGSTPSPKTPDRRRMMHCNRVCGATNAAAAPTRGLIKLTTLFISSSSRERPIRPRARCCRGNSCTHCYCRFRRASSCSRLWC